MTSSGRELLLRTPIWGRVWVTVFPALLAGFLVLVVRPDEAAVWAGGAVAVVLAALLAWRLARLAVIGSADGGLVVRNHWHDRTLHRDDVAEVDVARRAGGSNHSVRLLLRDGSTVRLEVTETPFAGPFRGRLARQADNVRSWATQTPRPYR